MELFPLKNDKYGYKLKPYKQNVSFISTRSSTKLQIYR